MTKKIGSSVLSLLLFFCTQAQEAIVWGAEIIDVSSEYSPLEFSAIQALHKPNVYPGGGQNPNAWRPKSENGKQFIMVAFANAIQAKQVAIAETENPGAIKEVYAYDEDYTEYNLFKLNPRAIPLESRLLNLFFPETKYGIKAIRIVLDADAVPGYNSIDAVGISKSNIPINVLVQLVPGINTAIQADKLSENVNSEYVEHSPILSPDGKKLYFSRKYHPDNAGGVDDPEDIWVSELDETTGQWKEAVNLGPPLNNPGPNFISSISKEGDKEVFILGNKYGKKGRMYTGTSVAYLENNKISDPASLEIENEYNYSPKADFFLVKGGQVMIHAVERDETYGSRDLYVSFKKGELWGEPQNMGNVINTASEEAAPFVAEDGKTMYFSSSGFRGYGGLDIYVTRRLDDTWTNWSPPENMGSGINSKKDDEYFSIPSVGENLYFTRGTVDDDTDIFTFKVDQLFIDPTASPIASSVVHLVDPVVPVAITTAPLTEPVVEKPTEEEKPAPKPVVVKPAEPEEIFVTVRGKVFDLKTNQPVGSVPVSIERLPDGLKIGQVNSNPSGEYIFTVRAGARYGMAANKTGYIPRNENIDLNKTKKADTLTIDLSLSPIETGRTVVMNNIFFAFDKDQLATSSYAELERILGFLKDGSISKIAISGHTDSTGPDDYNLQLSKRRAQAVYTYFVANGINASRLQSEGYGETQPVDSNDTPEGRKNNRRVEFKVIEAGK